MSGREDRIQEAGAIDPNPSSTTVVYVVPKPPPRALDGHKGDYGHVLVVGGSRGMAGAPALAGMGALRGGAGLATVACPKEILPTVAAYEPSYLTFALPSTAEGSIDVGAADLVLQHPATVLAVGPGVGQGAGAAELAAALLKHAKQPLVLDADGLNILAKNLRLLNDRPGPTVLTPHPGEFGRLTGRSVSDVQANREWLAASFALQHGVVLVLKGSRTIVTDGRRTAVNGTGNPGMATGGSGDVLTGLIAALLAQGMDPFSAARLGVHLHGLAGDLAAAEGSQESLIARDIVGALPSAWRQVRRNG